MPRPYARSISSYCLPRAWRLESLLDMIGAGKRRRGLDRRQGHVQPGPRNPRVTRHSRPPGLQLRLQGSSSADEENLVHGNDSLTSVTSAMTVQPAAPGGHPRPNAHSWLKDPQKQHTESGHGTPISFITNIPKWGRGGVGRALPPPIYNPPPEGAINQRLYNYTGSGSRGIQGGSITRGGCGEGGGGLYIPYTLSSLYAMYRKQSSSWCSW